MDGIREQQQPDEEAADPAAEASWALRRCFKVYRIEVSVRVHVVCLIREEEDESDLPPANDAPPAVPAAPSVTDSK